MQYPESHSTPRNKLKPLKSKDEFSSLRRRVKPLKEPLPNPEAIRTITTKHKPKIPGSDRIFSFMGAGTPKDPKASKKSKHKKRQQYSKVFLCRISNELAETKLKLSTEIIVIGHKTASCHEISFEYAIMDDRKWYRYTAINLNRVWEQFDLASEDHVPFKNECDMLGIKLVNIGKNLPPIGKKVNASSPPPRTSYTGLELTVKLLEMSTGFKPTEYDKNISMSVNQRGIYFNAEPFRFFKWEETSFEKLEIPDGNNHVIKLVTGASYAIVDVLSIDNMRTLNLQVAKFSKSASTMVQSANAAMVGQSSGNDVQKPMSSPEHTTNTPKRNNLFAPIDPSQFYSPQNLSLHQKGTLQRPLSASSPKNLHDNGISSSPVRSVESVRKLSVLENLPSDRHTASPFSVSPSTPFRNLLESRKIGTPGQLKSQSEGAQLPISEKITNHDQSRERLEKSPGRTPRRTRARLTEVELYGMEAEVEPTEEDCSLLRSEGYKRIHYRFWDGKSMHIGIEDIARLNPRIFVNDTVIWFFLRLFMEKLVVRDSQLADQILMLDTFFYFSMRSGDTPPSWVTKMPLTQKHVIVMPIHENSHWSVALIVGLDRFFGQENTEATSTIKPTVVIMDSLGPTNVYHVARKVITVIGNSLKIQGRQVLAQSDYRIMRADVPKQTNLTDCGVYLLHYIEQILDRPRDFLAKIASTEGRVLELGLDYWKSNDLYLKRDTFKQQLKQMGNVDDIPERTSTSSANGRADTMNNGTSHNSQLGQLNSTRSNNNNDEDDDDSIEVIGMETVAKKKRKTNLPSKSLNFGSVESKEANQHGEKNQTDAISSPSTKAASSRIVDLS